MKYLFLLLILSFQVVSANESADSCKNIRGTLSLWNGWAPYFRIEPDDKSVMYGIPEAGEEIEPGSIPDLLYKKVISDYHVTGVFCIQLTGDKRKVPYDKEPIIMVHIIKYILRK